MAKEIGGAFGLSRSQVLLKALSTQGPAWAFLRVRLGLSKMLGIQKARTPLADWDTIPLSSLLRRNIPCERSDYLRWREQNLPSFFFGRLVSTDADSFVGKNSIFFANEILDGNLPFFGFSRRVGFPPRWRKHPVTLLETRAEHWSCLNEYENGDIKLCWELSRFSWAFTLGRAYRRTGDELYADSFWQLFESWMEENPPNCGVHWMCGQEVSLRTMALCFASYAFSSSTSSTDERRIKLLRAVSLHARRVAAFIDYAISQQNNHAISEGSCLWTVGLLFPELKGASAWLKRGKRVIESAAERQIYEDGSYIQNSANYHRVMLQEFAWDLRLGELNDVPLTGSFYRRFCKSVRFLHSITDPISGCAPNYGPNDGALILPLSDCDYPDMRPSLQCCHYLLNKERLYPRGPWDEEMVWLNGLESLASEEAAQTSTRLDLDAEQGGCYTMHSSDSWLMIRGVHYRDRPSQADQLHVDMWWRGENVLCDPGTYSYNAPAPFEHAFASSRYHNCVNVDGADQMTRLTRFLWADWARARVRRYGIFNPNDALESEHDGYRKCRVNHRRSIVLIEPNTWVIVDDLTGDGCHSIVLHWLAQDAPINLPAANTIDLEFKLGPMRIMLWSTVKPRLDVVRAGHRIIGESIQEVDGARGWHSRYYAHKEPALSIAFEARTTLPVRFITTVMLGSEAKLEPSASLDQIQLRSASILLSDIGKCPVVVSRT